MWGTAYSWRCLVIAAVMVVTASVSVYSQAQAADPDGSVTSVDGEVSIVRNGVRSRAQSGAALIRGDRIEIAQGASICIVTTPPKQCLHKGPYIVPARAAATPNKPTLWGWMQKDWGWGVHYTETKARNDGRPVPLGDAILMPSGPDDDSRIQYVPETATSVVIVYAGTVEADTWKARTQSSGRAVPIRFDPDTGVLSFDAPLSEGVVVYAPDQGSDYWTFQPAKEIPLPDYYQGTNSTGGQLADPTDRLDRAVWLLLTQPSWRAYALSELQALAALEVPGARDFLAMAHSDGCSWDDRRPCPFLAP